MTTELTQITNLVKSKNGKVENISYKEVHKIKITKEDGDSPIVFNTKNVSSKLVDYSNAYLQFQFDIKFATDKGHCLFCCSLNLTIAHSDNHSLSKFTINWHYFNYSIRVRHSLTQCLPITTPSRSHTQSLTLCQSIPFNK